MHQFATLHSVARMWIKPIYITWLSLHLSVDAIFDKYVELTLKLKTLEDKGKLRGVVAKNFFKTMQSLEFVGALHTLKLIFLTLTTPSKAFQRVAIKVWSCYILCRNRFANLIGYLNISSIAKIAYIIQMSSA